MQTTYEKTLQEQAELELLNETAKTITIERTQRPKSALGRLWLYITGKSPKRELQTITIKPLTLGSILRISQEGQRLQSPKDLPEDAARMSIPDLSYHWAAVQANARGLARIVAIATLSGRAGAQEIEELADDVLHSITGGELASICLGILSASDLVGFTNSIRLMRASRVTNPDLIEKEV